MNMAIVSTNHDTAFELPEILTNNAYNLIHRRGGRTPEGMLDTILRRTFDALTKAQEEQLSMQKRIETWWVACRPLGTSDGDAEVWSSC